MELKDKKTKIKFYAGMRTIGGTYIEVSYLNHRVLFDCGSIFDPTITEEIDSLNKILSYELVPRIDGVFDKKITLENDEKYKNTAFCVSHVHLDHTKMINYIDESVPIYMTNDTKNILNACNVNKDFIFNNLNLTKNTRDLIGVNYGETVKIGEIQIKFIRVDHDAYGACAFVITTPDMKIAYTGDLRLHGYLENETLNFINEAKNCDVLISEGVSVSFMDFDDELEDEYATEKQLIAEFSDILNQNLNKQITFNYYITNIERLLKIIEISNRKVVLDALEAYVLYSTTGKKVNYYCLDGKHYNLDEKLEISYEELLNDCRKYLWQFKSIEKNDASKLKKNGIYIHCDASPLGEFDPSYLPFVSNFENNEINFKELKCSGHAHPKDLLKIIDGIGPKILVPIHSFKPEMLYNKKGITILPEKNEII
ncbi:MULTISPECIES: MBL fold metallo-hydrolase [Helcococcus]|uniref:MBL fold metallo-hydrolase n=3 Tax=Helcococcus bovis TaxID=3153252 RepID=A0ABW9F8K1_9FIRM